MLHPSALLPFALFLLSSFDLLIASRDLLGDCLLRSISPLSYYRHFLDLSCNLPSLAEDEVNHSLALARFASSRANIGLSAERTRGPGRVAV